MGSSSSKTVCDICGKKSVRKTVRVAFRMDGSKHQLESSVCTRKSCGYKSTVTRTLVSKEEAAVAGTTQDQVFDDIRATIHGTEGGHH
jgi:hypothetical protein